MNETAWLGDMRPLLPGAVDASIKQSLRSVINEFYTQSAVFEYNYPAISIVAGTSTYLVPDVATGKVLYLLSATYNGNNIRVTNTGITPTSNGTPSSLWMSLDPVTINLSIIPQDSVASGLELKLALAPLTAEDSVLPDSLGAIHYQTILDGALGRLMKQPSKPWTDVAMSTYHLRRYRIGMARAKELTRKGFSSSELPWVFPKWA